MKLNSQSAAVQGGFSLIELMIATALLVIVMGAVFTQIQTAQQRASTEQNTLDLFQESREFMDQMSRDLRQTGYPNPRNFTAGFMDEGGTLLDKTLNPAAALGLVYADKGDLYFQGGIDGSNGNVWYTQYHYDSSTSGNCPCLRRSQVDRAATPMSETPDYTAEVQNVQNYADSTNPVPIFRYYTNGGTTEVSSSLLPLEWGGTNSNGSENQQLAAIDTIRIQVLVKSPYVDLKTGQAPVLTLVSTVKVNNCSQAIAGTLSCGN